MSVPRILIIMGLLSLLLLLLFFVVQGPKRPQSDAGADKLTAEFMKILPDDLTPDQVEEVRGLLMRFQRMIYNGQMPVEDEVDVKRRMTEYVSRGSMTRQELNVLMARVGYFSVRGSTPDSVGIHPLLEDSLK